MTGRFSGNLSSVRGGDGDGGAAGGPCYRGALYVGKSLNHSTSAHGGIFRGGFYDYDELNNKTRPRRAFDKRPPAPRKPKGKPGPGAHGGGSRGLHKGGGSPHQVFYVKSAQMCLRQPSRLDVILFAFPDHSRTEKVSDVSCLSRGLRRAPVSDEAPRSVMYAKVLQWWSISRYVVHLVTYRIHHPK